MSVCVSVSLICASNQDLNLISQLVLCLYMKTTTRLLVLLNQSRKNPCELDSSLSAYESCLVYLENSCSFYVIFMPLPNLMMCTQVIFKQLNRRIIGLLDLLSQLKKQIPTILIVYISTLYQVSECSRISLHIESILGCFCPGNLNF